MEFSSCSALFNHLINDTSSVRVNDSSFFTPHISVRACNHFLLHERMHLREARWSHMTFNYVGNIKKNVQIILLYCTYRKRSIFGNIQALNVSVIIF